MTRTTMTTLSPWISSLKTNPRNRSQQKQ